MRLQRARKKRRKQNSCARQNPPNPPFHRNPPNPPNATPSEPSIFHAPQTLQTQRPRFRIRLHLPKASRRSQHNRNPPNPPSSTLPPSALAPEYAAGAAYLVVGGGKLSASTSTLPPLPAASAPKTPNPASRLPRASSPFAKSPFVECLTLFQDPDLDDDAVAPGAAYHVVGGGKLPGSWCVPQVPSSPLSESPVPRQPTVGYSFARAGPCRSHRRLRAHLGAVHLGKNPILPPALRRLVVDFTRPSTAELLAHMLMVCVAEGAQTSPWLVERLIRTCQGDIRKTLLLLQFWCQGQSGQQVFCSWNCKCDIWDYSNGFAPTIWLCCGCRRPQVGRLRKLEDASLDTSIKFFLELDRGRLDLEGKEMKL